MVYYYTTMAKKILILDDNEDILELLKAMLDGEGYEVECLTYTDNICRTLNNLQPDLVIVDYILFGVNGGELCHQIKTNPLTSHIPVIMISAYPRVLGSLGNYGADVLISKPFELDDVVNNVNSLLAQPGMVVNQH
jgi:DNA-binding response OmpR family regulator